MISHPKNLPLAREIKDAIYDVLRKMDTPKFDWMKFKAMMEASGRYQLELIRDSKDDVVRYNVKCDGRRYNASQIGANVTALKILREYERIKREQEKLRQQTTAQNNPVAKTAQTKTPVTQNTALLKSSVNGIGNDSRHYIGTFITIQYIEG